MKFKLRILTRAQSDVRDIYEWLLERSPQGANRWFHAFEQATKRLLEFPLAWPLANEDEFVDYEVRHIPFKTRRGRIYRAIYTIVDDEIRILRVRGFGQPEVDDLGAPNDG